MQIDSLGLPKYGTDDLMDLIYKGKLDTLFKVYTEDNEDTKQFNHAVKDTGTGQALKFYEKMDISLEEFDSLLQNEWFMPNSYKQFDMEKYLEQVCPDNDISKQRVKDELQAFKKMGFENLLKFLHFLVTFMRDNKIVWGVGRGSSLASFVLFLLGINKVNPLLHNLDIHEFLR